MDKHLDNLKNILNDTVLKGRHFSEKDKQDIFNRINTPIKNKRNTDRQFLPKFISISFISLIIITLSIFTYNNLGNSDVLERTPNASDINEVNPELVNLTKTMDLNIGDSYKVNDSLIIRLNNTNREDNNIIKLEISLKNIGNQNIIFSNSNLLLTDPELKEQRLIRIEGNSEGLIKGNTTNTVNMYFKTDKDSSYLKFIYYDDTSENLNSWFISNSKS